MKKYSVVLILLSIVLMIGCQRSVEEPKDAIDEFVNSESDLSNIITMNQLKEKKSDFQKTTKNKIVVNNITMENLKKILMLNDVLGTKKLEWYSQEEEDPEIIDAITSESILQKIAQGLCEDYYYYAFDSIILSCSFSMDDGWNKEEIKKVLLEFEKLGYSDLMKVFLEMEQLEPIYISGESVPFVRLVRNNAVFEFQNVGSDLEINVYVQSGQMISPEKFETFIIENIVDGFYPILCNMGGKVERLILKGSENERGTTYSKRIELCFNKGELIQMDIYFENSSGKKYFKEETSKTQTFSPAEQLTLENLLENMVEDNSQITEFLGNMSLEKDQQGKIGNRIWKLSSHLRGGRDYKKVSIY